MRNPPEPWYAHQFPDRPLAEGARLCCCLLCAVALERCGVEDAHRPIIFHTDTRPFQCHASYAAYHRREEQLHDMLRFRWELDATWITGVSVGYRHGRAAYDRNPEGPYPLPLDDWPVCVHCGPLSDATCGRPALLGERPRRLSQKARDAAEASRQARASLVADVQAMLERRHTRAEQHYVDQWRGLHLVHDNEPVY